MATKRLTDTGVSNLNPPAKGRVEVWDSIVPGLGLRAGKRRKTFVAMVRVNGRVRRLSVGVFLGIGVDEARAKARETIEQAQNGIEPVIARHAALIAARSNHENTVASTVEEYIEKYAQRRTRSWVQTKRGLEL